MLNVRLPNGQVLVYNTANQLIRNEDGSWSLNGGEESARRWVATIHPISGLIVESQAPCRIVDSREEPLKFVADNIQSLGRNGNTLLLRRLKKQLLAFNTKTGIWKV